MLRLLFRLLQLYGAKVDIPVEGLIALGVMSPDNPALAQLVNELAASGAQGNITLAQVMALPSFEYLFLRPTPVRTYCPACYETIILED